MFVNKFPAELKIGEEFDDTLREFGYVGKYVYKDLTYLEDDPEQGILQRVSLEGNTAHKGDSLTVVFEVEHAKGPDHRHDSHTSIPLLHL